MSLCAFVNLFLLASVQAYSSGAPELACDSMLPLHLFPPQTSKIPYKLEMSPDDAIRAGDTVKVSITGRAPENVIKGLLVQVRDGSEILDGAFDLGSSSKYTQVISCGQGKALTHKHFSGEAPGSLSFGWTAPKDLKAKFVRFYVTVAESGTTFWVAKRSKGIRVEL